MLENDLRDKQKQISDWKFDAKFQKKLTYKSDKKENITDADMPNKLATRIHQKATEVKELKKEVTEQERVLKTKHESI